MATYDPKFVMVSFGGIIITGFADGSFVDVESDEAMWSTKTGADGEGVFQKSNNLAGKVTVRLMPTAFANSLLSALLNADIATSTGLRPLEISDANTGTIHNALRARIAGQPKKVYAKEAEAIEWEILCLDLVTQFGSSATGLLP